MANDSIKTLKKSKKDLEADLFSVIRQKLFDFQKEHQINISSVSINIGRRNEIGYEPENFLMSVHTDFEL